ncbi:MAG: ABC transporter permease [Methanospirillum sp.]|uniref:ABC transporter permease n=1 Tax=Methanospirillum sp. TaxID=45200 RepID=UPI0023729951|nr:ABC transporter permease [Methanospirillum sp.]MDD1729793.1 ABC transporter permease [Methanospirillum sp.]
MPGDYITNYLLSLGNVLPQETIDQFYREFGLNLPLSDQYCIYIQNILRGEWGYSYQYSVQVLPLILDKLFWTLIILVPATGMGICFGMILGAYSGWKARTTQDLACFNMMIIIRAIPSYWWAIMTITIFGYSLKLFPISGYTSISILYSGINIGDVMHHAILPIAVLTLTITAGNYYLMRNSMISVIGEDYITTARTKGLDEHSILWRHALKNASLPVITMATLQCASIVTGSIFVETIFSWPGIGLLTTEALKARDLPLLEGIFLLDTLVVILANLTADTLYPLIDPRVGKGVDE